MKQYVQQGLKGRLGTHGILLGLVFILLLSLHSLWAGYALVGKTFSGFGMEFSFITFPVDIQEWTGSKADFQYYEQIQLADGKKFQTSKDFRQYIQSLPPNQDVTYTVIRNHKAVKMTIPTMTFSGIDYFKIFVINSIIAFFYGILALFILFRRANIRQAGILLFLTLSSAAVYALRSGYDYLHQFLPIALIAYCCFPLSLLLLGIHLAQSKPGKGFLNSLKNLNLVLTSLVALSLAGLAFYISPAPYSHPWAFAAFISIYQFLVAYSLLNILLFVGLVLWSSLRKSQDELRNWQAKIVLIGSLFSFLPYLLMMGALWVFKMSWTLPSEMVATNTYLFILFVFYAILHDEGIALEMFFKKTVFYYILLFLFGMAYIVVNRLVTVSIEASFLHVSKDQIPLIAGLAAFILSSVFSSRLQALLATIFYRQRKQLNVLLESFIQDSTSTLEPPKMVELGVNFLKAAFTPQSLGLYLNVNPEAGKASSFLLYYSEKSVFQAKLEPKTPLLTPAQLHQFKRAHGFQQDVILPLHKNGALLGFFILDKKDSGLGYFAEDIQLLEKFAFYFVTGFYIACLSQKTLAAHDKTEATKRMEVMGTLASGVAHDFNNLLSTILMSVGMAKYLSEDPQILERLQLIQLSAEKGAAITRALTDYASTLPPDQAVSLYEILDELESQLTDSLPTGITLQLSKPEEDDLLLADKEQLLRALLELAHNAEIAMSGKGTLRIEVRKTGTLPSLSEPFQAMDQEFLNIRISDSGEGIPESIRNRIFDPFFSAWTAGRGIGLGLPIARQIIKNHNGALEYKSWEGEGTTFSVYLPLASHNAVTVLPDVALLPAEGQAHSLVLLIDDEFALRELLAEALTQHGYAVIEANDGQQGLERFKEHLDEDLLIVCDLEMPRFNGHQFIAAARELAPHQPIIVSTGDISRAEQKAFLKQGLQILQKPYTIEQLLTTIQQSRLRV
jgi:signal transduction histidine kinase